jgi:pimeloyl-ACP methyl ester carboxylesterase
VRQLLGVALVLTMGCADRLLLFPTRRPLDSGGAVRHLLPFHGGELELFHACSPGCGNRRAAVVDLALIGNGSRAEPAILDAAERWGDRPVEVWAVNWPGYGASSGEARLADIAPAALAAFDHVADGRPVIVSGHSLGTAAALYVAAHRPVAGLVLLNPPPLRQLIVGRHGWWNLWLLAFPVAWQVPCDLDSLANGRRCSAPAVFLLSGQDTIVPLAYQWRVVDAYVGPKQIVVDPTAGHNDFPSPLIDHRYAGALDQLWAKLSPEARR